MKMILIQNIFFFLFISCGMSVQDEQSIEFDNYVITKANKDNGAEVDYLYKHLKKRSADGIVLKQGLDKIPSDESKVQFIDVAVDKNLDGDYEIIKSSNRITLKANSRKTLYWLYYQYFQALSENTTTIKAEDLPPAIVNFATSKKVKFAFDYREPHLKTNLVKDYDVIVNTNNVENDWGIWGHQLYNTINKNPRDEFYSTTDGELNKRQLCFGKPAMYNFLVNFILENHGEKEDTHQKFVIAPADNNFVCTCASCAKLGNTKGNSSFSVVTLLYKLATRFPNHQFFTLDYLSVNTPPSVKMPKNTGVIISSIDLPRKVHIDQDNPYVIDFNYKVARWHKVCSSVYVWDYISNFDDYLTPFATLSVCKSNFEFYKSLGINGIFANGAGYDYSTFNDVHTYVLSALMQDPSLEINHLVNRFCKQHYGTSGQLIANYILRLESAMQTSNYGLDLYTGVRKMTKTYLNKNDFFEFYNAVGNLKSGETEEIDFKISQLHTGLMFTAMQINLANGFDGQFGFAKKDGNQIIVNSDYKDKLTAFEKQYKTKEVFLTRERDGMILNYLKDVKKEITDAKLQTNLLSKDVVEITSELDEDYTDDSLITDGIPALPFDYHNGWLIGSAADLVAEINGLNSTGLHLLKLSFLLDEHLKMRAPEKVEVIVNNTVLKTIYPTVMMSETARKLSLETSFNLSLNDNLAIKVYRNKTYKKFACDEIFLSK